MDDYSPSLQERSTERVQLVPSVSQTVWLHCDLLLNHWISCPMGKSPKCFSGVFVHWHPWMFRGYWTPQETFPGYCLTTFLIEDATCIFKHYKILETLLQSVSVFNTLVFKNLGSDLLKIAFIHQWCDKSGTIKAFALLQRISVCNISDTLSSTSVFNIE